MTFSTFVQVHYVLFIQAGVIPDCKQFRKDRLQVEPLILKDS